MLIEAWIFTLSISYDSFLKMIRTPDCKLTMSSMPPGQSIIRVDRANRNLSYKLSRTQVKHFTNQPNLPAVPMPINQVGDSRVGGKSILRIFWREGIPGRIGGLPSVALALSLCLNETVIRWKMTNVMESEICLVCGGKCWTLWRETKQKYLDSVV